MNNAMISRDKLGEIEIDVKPMLRARETEIQRILEALENIKGSNYWKVLEEDIFSKELANLYHKIKVEKDPPEIYRLQGKLEWVEKYADFDKVISNYRLELQGIRKKLNA